MPLDLSEEYKFLKKKVESTKKYKEVKKDITNLKKNSNKKYSDIKGATKESLNDFKEKKQKYQKDLKMYLVTDTLWSFSIMELMSRRIISII